MQKIIFWMSNRNVSERGYRTKCLKFQLNMSPLNMRPSMLRMDVQIFSARLRHQGIISNQFLHIFSSWVRFPLVFIGLFHYRPACLSGKLRFDISLQHNFPRASLPFEVTSLRYAKLNISTVRHHEQNPFPLSIAPDVGVKIGRPYCAENEFLDVGL